MFDYAREQGGSWKVVVNGTHNSGGYRNQGPQRTKVKKLKYNKLTAIRKTRGHINVGHYIPPRETAWLCGPSLLFGPAVVPSYL